MCNAYMSRCVYGICLHLYIDIYVYMPIDIASAYTHLDIYDIYTSRHDYMSTCAYMSIHLDVYMAYV